MFPGFLIELVIVLVIVGLVLWVLGQIPMDPVIAKVIRIVVVAFVFLWLLYVLVGFLPAGGWSVPHR